MKVSSVLVLTNMYPHGESQKGIFVKEFVDVMNSSEKFELDVLSIDTYAKSYMNYIFSFIHLFLKLKSKKYSIINVHFGLSIIPVLMLYPLIRYRKIRIITTLHGSDLMGTRVVNLISNVAVLLSESVIVVSKEMCSFILKPLREKVNVIPCGVDLGFTYFSRPYWNKNNVLDLIFPSDPSRKEKNYKLFDEVVCKLEQSGIRVKVHIFKGLSRKQIRSELKSCNLLFLSSLREGSPQVVKEAVLTGLPVVTTNVGDVNDTLKGLPDSQQLISDCSNTICSWILDEFEGGSLPENIVEIKRNELSVIAILKKQESIFLNDD